ncbi:hypothetical protein PTTG_11949 [Puccinia triticina 1-1 BBBD Race 1]|uniref:Uncharacterized protein n=2 Tax=Puccinia triticina TaxID=208348 RepID=A0A180GGY6_PUCT1|nr:uncharacterized protein PtA15_1A744 [Puccinia triticina]OAV91960.1 hypothetical protein PTTG_11949 [Puccinia triticina 1-1 BBBD Race 1]WAQ81403.1 hypothetical protein PtA15_1A744 [Puccinia triticina]
MLLEQFQPVELPCSSKLPKQASTGAPPQNTFQSQLLEAAKLVHNTIQSFDRGLCTKEPFCLRYPTYSKVLENSISMQDKCRVLPKDKMVVLLDEAGICVGVGVPPFAKVPGKLHMEPDERACKILNSIVSTNSWDTADNKVAYLSAPVQPPASPFPLGPKNKGEVRSSSEANKKQSMLFQAYGYGLGDAKSKGMHDLKIQFSKNRINTAKLQGYGNSWKEKRFLPTLPNPLRESQNAIDTQAMAKFRNEITFYSKLSLWINKAFLPRLTDVAEGAVKYLMGSDSDYLVETLSKECNPILASQTISVNTQVQTHRDKKNALLFDSSCFFGNHLGGEFLLPSLGVAYPGLHGYSFHGPLRIVLHGVAKFTFPEDLKDPPRRYSVAFWSRASSFAAVAKCSAYDGGNQKKSPKQQ